MSTIFTRIIQGEVPSHKIYEDSKCQAFLDINPITKGHTLLVPREEYTWMTDTPDELISHLFIVAKQLMQQMKQHLGANHVQLHIEGVEVPHFHIHLIPIQEGQKVVSRSHTTYENGEAAKIANKIAGKSS